MALANVISLQSGTNFIINVAAAQLSSDVTEKDFTVLHNGTAVANVSYNKTTPTTLQYVGASLPSTTIEIRRKTSFDQAKNLVTYANRFSSTKWNESLLRIQRWEEEVDLNGAGSIGAGVIPIPANDPYGSIWTNDTIYSPTRKVLWDKIQTLATKASPALTGVPTAPTAAFTNSSTQLATTAHVKDVLGNTPAITNPTVSNGSFTSPTIATPAINGGTIQNSVWTAGALNNTTIGTSTFAGGSITQGTAIGDAILTNCQANQQLGTDYSSSIASTAWVKDWNYSQREYLLAAADGSFASGALTQIGMLWNQRNARGGANVVGLTNNWCRVATSGWFRFIVKFEEASNSTDYNYLTLFLSRLTPGGFVDQARLFTLGMTQIAYPHLTAAVTIPVTWEPAVDKIFTLRFQQNNAANATRNFHFDMEIEKLFY